MKDKIIEVLKDYAGCTDTIGQTTYSEMILEEDFEEVTDRLVDLFRPDQEEDILIRLFKDKKLGGFSIISDDIPEAIAEGETIKEALYNLQTAIEVMTEYTLQPEITEDELKPFLYDKFFYLCKRTKFEEDVQFANVLAEGYADEVIEFIQEKLTPKTK